MADVYKTFLKNLSDHLTSSDVETIKFLCEDDLPAGIAENLHTSFSLLIAMDRAQVISKDNLDRLYKLLNAIPRRDLLVKLDEFCERISQSSDSKNGKLPAESNMEHTEENKSYIKPIPRAFSTSAMLNEEKNNETLTDNRCIRAISSGGFTDSAADVMKVPNLSSSVPNIVLMKPEDFEKKTNTVVNKLSDVNTMMNVDINATEYSPKTYRQKSTPLVRPEEYSMNNHPHGNCVIFSNEFNQEIQLTNGCILKKRSGTEQDVISLSKTFSWLGFEIDVYRDQSGIDMMEILKAYAKQQSRVSTDCFVCCILSHGYEGGIYGNYGSMVSTKDLQKIFEGDNCESLVEKPKLIFIQACQGEADGKGVKLQGDTPAPITQDHYENKAGITTRNEAVFEQVIATDADFLFFMATTPGTTSWRDPINGSWFVQTLCRVLQENAMDWNLMEMLLEVNNKIALKEAPLYNGVAKQMSNFGKNTMRKNLLFSPKCDFDSSIHVKMPSEL